MRQDARRDDKQVKIGVKSEAEREGGAIKQKRDAKLALKEKIDGKVSGVKK